VFVPFSNRDVLVAFGRLNLVSAPLAESEAERMTVYTSLGNEVWIYVLPDGANAAEAFVSGARWVSAPNDPVPLERLDVENVAVVFDPAKRLVVERCLDALRAS
jgi:hypothetical protein